MKIAAIHSHFNGLEWLIVHEKTLWQEIQAVIKSIKATKEKKPLSPIDINKEITKQFHGRGWQPSHRPQIVSHKQTDFHKKRIAVEVQLTKHSGTELDLFIKHLGSYIRNSIDVGVEIVPTKTMQEQMSSGLGYYERVLHHVARQGRGAPAVPLVIIGVEP